METIWIKDGKFNELSENEVHGLEVGDLGAYHIAKNSDDKAKLEAKIEEKAGTDVVEALKEQVGELTKKHFDNLEEIVKTQGIAIKEAAKDKRILDAPKHWNDELKMVWKNNAEAISDFVSGKDKSGIQMNLKTEVTRASVIDNSMAQDQDGIARIPRRGIAISSLFNQASVGANSNGVIRYWEEEAQTDNSASVAESAAIPESAISWRERTCPLEKIGDSIPVTREALEDVGFVEAEIRNFLMKNIELQVDNQSLLGTGASNQLKGVTTIAPDWAAGNFADVIATASIYDVLSTGLVQVANAGQNNVFVPTAIIMNPEDAELMRLEKDTQGNYITPMWMSSDGMSVRGVRIIESQLVTQDQAFIGDFTFGTLWGTGGTVLDVAQQHGTDWLDDVTRLKATVRKALVIRDAHVGAFLHINGIAAAQVALDPALP